MAKKQLPKVSVIDRRLAHPFGAPSVPITMKDGQQWAIRIANDKVRAGRVHQMGQLGWTSVEPSEIDGTASDYGLRVMDGRLVRGEHGEEVLMKMPQADYDAIADRKAELNLKALGSAATKASVAQATSQEFGDQAGETVFKNIEVSDGRVLEEMEPAS